ncbi:MAG: hypothetical protein AAGI38_00960 [Bacteroidota bacterium]
MLRNPFFASCCIIFLFLLGDTCCVFSQVPGYLGQKNILHLRVTGAPAVAYGSEEGLWGPNLKWGLGWERVISRRFSLGLVAYQIGTKVRYANFQKENGLAHVWANAAGVQIHWYNFFKRGNIAPIGPYQRLEVMYLNYRLQDIDRKYYLDGRENLGNFDDLAFTFAVGTKGIIGTRLSYHVGIQTGTMMRILSTSFISSSDPDILGAARLIRHMSFNLECGIGYLFK